ncbi:hypothetical protein LINGRAHAP2_LOCUS31190 [Linum grandiflorum]
MPVLGVVQYLARARAAPQRVSLVGWFRNKHLCFIRQVVTFNAGMLPYSTSDYTSNFLDGFWLTS